jgi:Tol biopolymer transport system component
MVFIFKVIIGVFALLFAVMGIWLAVGRDAPGPSMLAYATYRGKADIVATWPGNATVRWLVDTPTHDIQPTWSPACSAAADCRLSYVLDGKAGGAAPGRQLRTVGLVSHTPVDVNPVAGESVEAVWSPDGAYLASVQRSGDQTDVYIIRARDGAATNLSDHPRYDSQPYWSPDGSRLAFVSSRGTEIPPRNTVYIATFDDNKAVIDLQRLTAPDRNEKLLGWSPDGEWVMFTAAGRPGFSPLGDMFVVRVADGETIRVVRNLYRYANPVWSPDGAWIAYEIVYEGNHEIAVVRPDGTDQRILSRLPGVDRRPVWSPDGSWVVFESRDVDNRDLYIVRPDGSGLRNLSDHPALDVGAVWSADGRWIAFESMRDGNREIYIVRPDGTGLTNMSLYKGIDAQPAWSPPITLAFRPWVLIGMAGVLGLVVAGRWGDFSTQRATRVGRNGAASSDAADIEDRHAVNDMATQERHPQGR